METMHWRKYTAEFLGTGILTFAVLGSLQQQTPTPFIAGFTLLLIVYLLGGISGAHVNPAVTVGLWSIRKIRGAEVALYIAAQLLGAVAAEMLFWLFAGALPPVAATTSLAVVVAEATGAFILVLGVSAVVADKVHRAASGLAIGGSLLLGIVLATLGSNGVLNPAVAIGIRSISLGYLLAPFIGGVLAAQLYRWMAKE